MEELLRSYTIVAIENNTLIGMNSKSWEKKKGN